MRIIFEKNIENEEGAYFVECEEAEATHKHFCYNDEENPQPCRREKI